MLGGALQVGSINDKMFICAHVISGIGCGHLNAIVPVWSAEIASSHARGTNPSIPPPLLLLLTTNIRSLHLPRLLG